MSTCQITFRRFIFPRIKEKNPLLFHFLSPSPTLFDRTHSAFEYSSSRSFEINKHTQIRFPWKRCVEDVSNKRGRRPSVEEWTYSRWKTSILTFDLGFGGHHLIHAVTCQTVTTNPTCFSLYEEINAREKLPKGNSHMFKWNCYSLWNSSDSNSNIGPQVWFFTFCVSHVHHRQIGWLRRKRADPHQNAHRPSSTWHRCWLKWSFYPSRRREYLLAELSSLSNSFCYVHSTLQPDCWFPNERSLFRQLDDGADGKAGKRNLLFVSNEQER